MTGRRSLWATAVVVVISLLAIVGLVAWPRPSGPDAYDAMRPSQPRDPELSGTTLSWLPPESSPVPLTSYSVLYRPVGDPEGQWSVYARESLAMTIDVSGTSLTTCAAANPAWSCALTGGELLRGTEYTLRVIARTANALGYMSTDVLLTPG